MAHERIERLLEAYWAGETSLSEETELRLFFQQEAIPEKWRSTAALFAWYEKEGKRKRSQAVETEASKYSEVSPLRHRWLTWSLRIAAGMLLLFGIYSGVEWNQAKLLATQEVEMDTFEDPEEAYKAVKEALFLVSSRMGAGKKHSRELNILKRSSDKLLKISESDPSSN